jgi:hypothetical protein
LVFDEYETGKYPNVITKRLPLRMQAIAKGEKLADFILDVRDEVEMIWRKKFETYREVANIGFRYMFDRPAARPIAADLDRDEIDWFHNLPSGPLFYGKPPMIEVDELPVPVEMLQRLNSGAAVDPDTKLSASDIAEKYALNLGAFKKRLKRWRTPANKGSDWIEVADRKPSEDQYLYRLGAVADIVAKCPRASRPANVFVDARLPAPATFAGMSNRVEDKSISTLRRMLREAVRAVGADSVTATILRRTILAKQLRPHRHPRDGPTRRRHRPSNTDRH